MKTTVESCFPLDVHLLKRDLRRARKHERGIAGYLNITHSDKQSVADYSFEYDTEFDYLVIQYGENEQKIKLAETELYFGVTSVFQCNCGKRVSKLYLPPGATEFKCRRCHSLVYTSQCFNKNTKSGNFLYKNNQIIKLINRREDMRSIFYCGKYTKRFNRILQLSEILGLQSIVDDAKRLISVVNGS